MKVAAGKIVGNKGSKKQKAVIFGWKHRERVGEDFKPMNQMVKNGRCKLDTNTFYSVQDLKTLAYNIICSSNNRGYFEDAVIDFGTYNNNKLEKFGTEEEDIGLWEYLKQNNTRTEPRFYLLTTSKQCTSNTNLRTSHDYSSNLYINAPKYAKNHKWPADDCLYTITKITRTMLYRHSPLMTSNSAILLSITLRTISATQP